MRGVGIKKDLGINTPHMLSCPTKLCPKGYIGTLLRAVLRIRIRIHFAGSGSLISVGKSILIRPFTVDYLDLLSQLLGTPNMYNLSQ